MKTTVRLKFDALCRRAHLLRAAALIVGCPYLTGLASGVETGTAPESAASTSTGTGPRIQFAELVHDFGRVQSGEVVNHSYTFTNTGDRVLMITSVRPSCGCTAAETWDKEVQPGKTGSIPVRFSSAGFGGPILKTVSVTCNDLTQTNVVLQLKGTAWKPIEVSPLYAIFSPEPDSVEKETRILKIVNTLEEPLTLSKPACTNNSFQAELTTVREGKEFELRVSALPPFNLTNRLAQVTLKTSCSKMPEVSVNCYLNVRPPFICSPSRIVLPTNPLSRAVTNVVTIRNNGTNEVVLSKPEVSVEGVGVELKESKPGREYSVVLVFPAGFKSQPGQDMEVRVSSNHPKHPVIKVSIFQMAFSDEDSGAGQDAVSPKVKATTAALQH